MLRGCSEATHINFINAKPSNLWFSQPGQIGAAIRVGYIFLSYTLSQLSKTLPSFTQLWKTDRSTVEWLHGCMHHIDYNTQYAFSLVGSPRTFRGRCEGISNWSIVKWIFRHVFKITAQRKYLREVDHRIFEYGIRPNPRPHRLPYRRETVVSEILFKFVGTRKP